MHSPRAAAVDENQERQSVSGMLASLFGGFGSAFPTCLSQYSLRCNLGSSSVPVSTEPPPDYACYVFVRDFDHNEGQIRDK
jgi:hypothetical protein